MRSILVAGLAPGFSSGRAPYWASCCLLVLAVTAACSDDGFPNQSTGQTPTSTTDAADGSEGDPTTGAAVTTGMSDGTTVSPPTDSTGESPADSSTGATTEQTSGSTGTTGDTTDGTTGDEPNAACAAGCAVEFMCGTEWATEEDCVAWCETNLVKAAAFSPFCSAAWENVSACVATLTCEEFAEWENPMMFPYPCSDADVVLSVECKGQ